MADAEAASTAEQPVSTPAEGNSTLVRVRPEPRGWDHPRVLWWSRDDPEGEPLFALEDVAEGGAGAPSSNFTSWRCGRCGQRCSSWLTICPVLPRCALSFPVLCRLFQSFLVVLDPCFAYLGAQGLVPREVDIPPAGEGCLGPAPATDESACRCQRASVGMERGGGGPPPSPY